MFLGEGGPLERGVEKRHPLTKNVILRLLAALEHRCDKRLQRLQKIFVNAFIILSTFISIKIT